MANQVKCSKCEVLILEITANYNAGLCAPCNSDQRGAEIEEVVQSWLENPGTLPGTNDIPMPEDIALSIRASQIRSRLFPTEEDKMENHCHAVFDKAHDKWMKFGPLFLTKREKYTLAVETFYGEVWNGGILQYLGNESGTFANWADKAFDTIDIPELSEIVKEVKSLFSNSKIPQNSDKRWDIVETLDDEALESLTQKVFDVCEEDENIIRNKLYDYLK